MKQIIIFLLLVIIGILGYNFYEKWQRFHPPNYHYKAEQVVDANHSNKDLLMNYYQAVEALNGYVITQWGANEIDVRNPEDDDAQTVAAVSEYNKKLGAVKYYESQLLNTKVAEPEVEQTLSEEDMRNQLVYKMFNADPKGNTLRLGERNAFIYEIQRLLVENGDSIRRDGLFRTETFNALRSFEERKGLLADGRLDLITLEYLLK